MGLAAKLVAVLATSALLLLAAIGAMQYHAGLLAVDRGIQQTLAAVLGRLAVSLPLSLDEFDIGTMGETARSEFAREEIHTILIWNGDHTRLLSGIGRDAAGIHAVFGAPDDPDLIKGARELAVTPAAGQQTAPAPLGSVEVFISKDPVLQKLHRHLLRNLLQQAILVALLVVILAYVADRYLVRPLEAIRQAMSTDDRRHNSGSGTILSTTPLSRGSLKPAFDEIVQMGATLKRMVAALDRQQKALAAKEADLRITLDSIGDAVIATDPEGMVVRMNPVAEKLTGWQRTQAQGQPLKSVFQVMDRESREPVPDPFRTVMADQGVADIPGGWLLRGREKQECLIAPSGAPIRDEQGRAAGVVLVFRDITAQVKLEEQLVRVRKLNAIGQLAGGVAHDFNNMLTGILGAAEMLELTVGQDPKSHRYVQIIRKAAQDASDLTAKLLVVGRRQQRTSQPLDCHEAFQAAADLLQRSIDRRITLEVKLDATQSVLRGDSTQLQNAFLNLGVNARDAMPQGGQIILSTQDVNLGTSYCRASPFDLVPGPYIQISVKDTGSGMDQQALAHLFEPFFTTKASGKGTGLGLAAVYSTIRDHKGAIHVYSETGQGTVFHIFLPIAEGLTLPAPPPADDREPVKGSGCVLVIEDEAVIRDTVRAQLEDLGYEVILAEDGVAGLTLYQQHWKRIDAVILDLIMPRMNGEECFRALKQIDSRVKVLVASGFVQRIEIDQLLNEGVCGFLQKPYRRVQLSQVLAEVIAAEHT